MFPPSWSHLIPNESFFTELILLSSNTFLYLFLCSWMIVIPWCPRSKTRIPRHKRERMCEFQLARPRCCSHKWGDWLDRWTWSRVSFYSVVIIRLEPKNIDLKNRLKLTPVKLLNYRPINAENDSYLLQIKILSI